MLDSKSYEWRTPFNFNDQFVTQAITKKNLPILDHVFEHICILPLSVFDNEGQSLLLIYHLTSRP